MGCSTEEQIAIYANADTSAVVQADNDEQALDELLTNHVATFSNGEIELHEAQDYALEKYRSLYQSLVFRTLTGDEVAIKGLQRLMQMSALELNEIRGNRH